MPLSFAVVCEAPADHGTASALADRVFCAEVEWISEAVLDDYRKWRDASEQTPFLLWKEVSELARQANIRPHGHFDGEPALPDANAARRALLLLKASEAPLHGVLLIRDDDRDEDRRRGLEQARNSVDLGAPVVIGLAHTKRECWVLAGFDLSGKDEARRLEDLRRELGFDPRTGAENLTAKHDHDKRSAKRVLAVLTGGDRGREAECWLRYDLRLLEQRGQATGLTDFLREVRTLLAPLFK
jgi:hypothetical protein